MQRTIFEPEHEIFREGARRFFQQQIGPHAERWREQGRVDRDAFRLAGEQGYLLMWADEQYGGAGVQDFRYEQILAEENHCYGEPGFYLVLHSRLVAPYIGKLGTDEQKARILPKCASGESILAIAMTESGCGSDLAGMRTRAELKNDHWVLNGSKTYISNGQLADYILVAAKTSVEDKYALGIFIVERGMPGFHRGRNLDKMGLKAQDTSELFFDGVRIPLSNVLADPKQGFKHLISCLAEERLIAAVGSMGHAQAAFDLTLEYVKEREAFGRPIGTFQHSRFQLASLRTELDAVQCFVDQCVLLNNAGHLDAVTGAQAKLLSTEIESKTMDVCVQLHGGAGYMAEYRISRMFTDARASRILAGTSEIMKEIIGRSLGLDERKLP